jgi:hypothetical protein
MPKKIDNEPKYLAKDIYSEIVNGKVKIFDQRKSCYLKIDNIDDKITIYERQVKDWFLNIGQELSNNNDTGFVGLMICLAYIEGVEQYRNGKSSNGQSKKFFVAGLKRIFETYDICSKNIEQFYKDTRCGLFHNGMSNNLVINTGYEKAIHFLDDKIQINPNMFFQEIERDFKSYILDLRDLQNQSLRQNFNKMYKLT